MLSTTIGVGSSSTQVLGGVVGLAAAVVIGYLFYAGTHRVDLRVFFRVTGVLIILFAAGLVAKGVHEFQELGFVPTISEHVWSLGLLEPSTSTPVRISIVCSAGPLIRHCSWSWRISRTSFPWRGPSST